MGNTDRSRLEMALEVKIKKKLGKFQLDVEFTAEQEIMAILGASGCGKSLTLKCIAGIETPDEGWIRLNGRTLFDSAAKINLPPQKRHVGYMFQDYALFPNMNVRKNVAIGMKHPEEIQSYISRFQLDGLEQLFPYQLSGGQKQRVAMARMIASEPEILLLDEPFSALDSHLRWKMEQEVKATLLETQKTTLFVSHSRDEVYRVCETVGTIVAGKMAPKMTVRELFENPGTREAAQLSGCRNIAEIVRETEHTAFVPAWKIRLNLERSIPEDIRYIGIRAHYFIPCGPEENNLFLLSEKEVSEEPFEWNVAFRQKGAEEWVHWRVSKEILADPESTGEYLTVREKDIMMLR